MSVLPLEPHELWVEALERLDVTLDEAWTAVGRADLPAAAAAIDALAAGAQQLPTLPVELTGRVTEVVARMDGLAAFVDDARLAVLRDLTVAERLATTGPAVPRFIDRRT